MIGSDTDREPGHLATITGQSTPDLARDAVIEWMEEQKDIRDAKRSSLRRTRRSRSQKRKRTLAWTMRIGAAAEKAPGPFYATE